MYPMLLISKVNFIFVYLDLQMTLTANRRRIPRIKRKTIIKTNKQAKAKTRTKLKKIKV